MVSVLEWPHFGQVRTDSRTISVMLFAHSCGESGISSCLGQVRRIRLVSIEANGRDPFVEVHIDFFDPGHLLQGFADGDLASRAGHILQLQYSGLDVLGEGTRREQQRDNNSTKTHDRYFQNRYGAYHGKAKSIRSGMVTTQNRIRLRRTRRGSQPFSASQFCWSK
jgi:hypothetical protein